MARGFMGASSPDLPNIMDPFRTIFADLEPDRLSETSTAVLSQQQTSDLKAKLAQFLLVRVMLTTKRLVAGKM